MHSQIIETKFLIISFDTLSGVDLGGDGTTTFPYQVQRLRGGIFRIQRPCNEGEGGVVVRQEHSERVKNLGQRQSTIVNSYNNQTETGTVPVANKCFQPMERAPFFKEMEGDMMFRESILCESFTTWSKVTLTAVSPIAILVDPSNFEFFRS